MFNELFDRIWPFCGVGTWRFNTYMGFNKNSFSEKPENYDVSNNLDICRYANANLKSLH